MGIYRPFLGGMKSLGEFQEADHSHDKPFTPADIMTVSRPVLAAKVASMLLKGQQGAFWVAAGMAASDMEGKPARLIDKFLPDSGWGTTEHGAAWDTYADTAAVLILGAAILKAPRVTAGAKVATAVVLGQEGIKAGWAIMRDHEYQPLSGERLKIPSSLEGKEAMAEKLTAVALAVATNDVENGLARASFTAGALYFAGVGAWRGERARQAYEPLIAQMMEDQQHLITPKDTYGVPGSTPGI